MKIVVHDYAGHAFPTSLSRALAARGHHVVHAFAGALQTPRGDLTRRAGDAETLEFREIAMDPEYPRYKYSFRRRRRMEIDYGHRVAEFIREWKPDAVLSGNTPTETQGSICRAVKETHGRFYYWVQDFYSLAVDKLLRRKIPLAGPLIGAWYKRLDRAQFRASARVIAITEDFNPILAGEFGVARERIEVVPNWALIEEIPVRKKHNAWSEQHALHDKFVFLYSGTIGMKHNPALLRDLARRYRDDPAVRVVVVSEGLGADWLKREAAADGLENLLVLPYQPFSHLPDVLATGDVLVGILEPDAGVFSVPSKTLSYLCAHRPLLLAMPRENLAARIAVAEQAGLVAPPDDIPAFLSAAETLRTDHAERRRLAANARAYADKTFPIHRTVERFDAILTG